MLGLQHVNLGPYRGSYVYVTMRGPESRQGWVRGGQDVVDTELDFWFWFALTGVGDGVVLLWTRSVSVRVQRAEGGVRLWASSRGALLVTVALHRLKGGLSGITEANFHVPSAPATPKVAVLKQVEHGLTAGGKSPVVSFAFLVALGPRNLLWEKGRTFLIAACQSNTTF